MKSQQKYNKLVADETIEDYSLRYAPKSFRKWSEFTIANTAIGSISFLALEAIGASIAISYGFSTAFWAILTAALIIFITAIPISYHAARYNIDIDLITRSAGFGYIGSTFTSLIYASFSFIFFALEAAIMAQALEVYFGIPLSFGYIISSLVIVPIVFYGITFITKLQNFTQPIWFIMMVAPFIAILYKDPDSLSIFTSMVGTVSKTDKFNIYYFGMAVGISLSLIAQIGEQVDYLRFMPPLKKDNRIKWWSAVILAGPGWIILGFAKQVGGAFLASLVLATGFSIHKASTPIEMYSIGYQYIFNNPDIALLGATIFILISQVKINVTNAYAGSLAWSNFFSRITHSHPGRVVWMFFNIAIALMLMEFGVFDVLSTILGLYSNVAIAWIGVIFADLVINKPLGLAPKVIEFKRAYLYNINPVGVISMGIASIVSIFAFIGYFGQMAQSYSSIIAMFIAIILSPTIAILTKGKYYIARENKNNYTHIQTCTSCNHSYEVEDMAYCPLNKIPICSLCCSLDAMCHDNCKKDNEKSFRDGIASVVRTLFAKRIPKEIALKIFDFTLLSLFFFFIVWVAGWISYSMQIDLIADSAKDIFKSSIENYSIMISILISMLIFWIILMRGSQERSEKELEEQKDYLKNFYNTRASGILIVDKNRNILDVNPTFCKIWQYSKEEIVGKNAEYLHVNHEAFVKFGEIAFSKIQQKKPIDINYQLKKKDGTIFWAEFSGEQMINSDNVSWIIRDITALKEATFGLEKQKNTFEYLFNNTIETIGIFQDGKCIDINEAGVKLFGFTKKADALGLSALTFIAPNSRELAMKYIRDGALEAYQANVIKCDGTIFPALIQGQSKVTDGIETRITSLFDISELKNKEIELELAKNKAEESTRLKSEFLANMSHEIRTPMNGILGMTYLALQTKLNKNQKHYLEIIKNSSDNLLNIINDILDFSKIEAGKLEINKIDFDVRALLASMKNMMISKAQEKGLEFTLKCNCESGAILVGDRFRISQVLINLINNAIKFTQSGRVVVTVNKLEHSIVRFSVKDTGIGISKENQQKLFQSFSQADGSTTRKYGGTGLGLSISKQLVELMGGKIWVESKVDIGSNFIFEISLTKGDKSKIEATHDTKLDINMPQGSHILLVEDNPINQEIITGLLKNSGIKIDIANNGQEAVAMIQSNSDKYELVFMDIQMPIMDGYEATKIIRKLNTTIPIVALTANAMREDVQRTREVGMQDHLNKPVEIDKLYAILLKYMSKKMESSHKDIAIQDDINIINFINIDTKAGLSHMANNNKLYLKILNDFYNNYKDVKLEKLDEKELKMVAHTIKSLSANIGAKSLSAITKEIEKTLNKELFTSFYHELKKVMDELKDLKIQTNKERNLLTLSDEKKEELFASLKEFAKKHRTRQCREILEEFDKYSLPIPTQERVRKIKIALDKRDYNTILERT